MTVFSEITKLDTSIRKAGRQYSGFESVAFVAALDAGGSLAAAQIITEQERVIQESATEANPQCEFLVWSGTLIPTGTQRGAIKRERLSAGGEFSFRPREGRVPVRLGVRDSVSGLIGEGTGGARNNVVALIGLRFTKQAG